MQASDNLINNIATKPKDRSNRLDALLALRGFACLMVVISHCTPPRASIIYRQFDFSWLIFSSGMVAVWIFFCLSGYLMGKAFYTQRYTADVPGVIDFWRNRGIRIFPLYYFAVLIVSLFVNPEVLKMENWGYLLRDVLLLTIPISSLMATVTYYLIERPAAQWKIYRNRGQPLHL